MRNTGIFSACADSTSDFLLIAETVTGSMPRPLPPPPPRGDRAPPGAQRTSPARAADPYAPPARASRAPSSRQRSASSGGSWTSNSTPRPAMRRASQSSESSLPRYSQRPRRAARACPTSREARAELVGRGVQRHARGVAVLRAAQVPGDERRRVPARQLARGEARAHRARAAPAGRAGRCASPRARRPTPRGTSGARGSRANAARRGGGCPRRRAGGRRSARSRGRGRRSRAAVSASGSTVAAPPPQPGSVAVAARSALTRRRRCDGRICSSFTSARTAVSSIPATDAPAAARSPTAIATASSSSSSSGGIAVPARRR